jgi:AbrB family looped-hinge helix DNA binding protein
MNINMKSMKAGVAERGQVTVPKALGDRLGLLPGTTLELSEERGRLVAVKTTTVDPVAKVYGCLGRNFVSSRRFGALEVVAALLFTSARALACEARILGIMAGVAIGRVTGILFAYFSEGFIVRVTRGHNGRKLALEVCCLGLSRVLPSFITS